jgi:predicted RNase H-like HicB family nuclease
MPEKEDHLGKDAPQEVTVVIEKVEEGGFKASIEGINGLAAEGQTVVSARKNLWDTIRALKDKLFSGKPFKITEKVRIFFPKSAKK